MKKVALLCDVSGLWWAATRYGKGRVDYTKLISLVAKPDRTVIHAEAWLVDRPGLDKFQAALRIIGYNTNVMPRGASIDQLIAHAALEASKAGADAIAIAASSGRFQSVCAALRDLGKELEVWAFPVACPLDDMHDVADRWNQLGDTVLLAS